VFDLRSKIFCCDSERSFAPIVVINSELVVKKIDDFTSHFMTTVAVLTKSTTIYIVNVYFHPNSLTPVQARFLENAVIQLQNYPMVLSGDFNSRSPLWYDPVLNSNGRKLVRLVEDHDLFVHNHRGPTCRDR